MVELVRGRRKIQKKLKISHIGRSLALLSQNFAKMGTFGLLGLFLHFWGSKIHFMATPDRGGAEKILRPSRFTVTIYNFFSLRGTSGRGC